MCVCGDETVQECVCVGVSSDEGDTTLLSPGLIMFAAASVVPVGLRRGRRLYGSGDSLYARAAPCRGHMTSDVITHVNRTL